jgi:hypothetical protein
MNDVFNLPAGITSVGDWFASCMFCGCSGTSFTMNDVFNLPQGITTVDDYFVYAMFSGCSGAAFQVNDVFTFPRLPQAELDRSGVVGGIAFRETFQFLNPTVKQKRSAISIINNPNGNPMTAPYYTLYPAHSQGTFDAAFVDQPLIHPNWGGLGQPGDCLVSFDANGFAGISFPGGSTVLCMQNGLVATPALQLATGSRLLGWYRDAACTQPWDLGADVIPVGTTAMTLYAKGISPLVFVDLGFGVPASTVGTVIAPISTAPGVSGGQLPYAFSAAGLPAGLAIDPVTGEITGTPTTEQPAGTAVITVTDALGQTASISIITGEVSKASGSGGGNGNGGNGNGGGGNGGNGGGTGNGGGNGGSGGNNGGGSGSGGSGSNGGAPASGNGGGGAAPGKGNNSGSGMAKTGDGLGMLATGAALLALAAFIALFAAGAAATLCRRREASGLPCHMSRKCELSLSATDAGKE